MSEPDYGAKLIAALKTDPKASDAFARIYYNVAAVAHLAGITESEVAIAVAMALHKREYDAAHLAGRVEGE